ncbi:S8 family serine peptidase [Labilibaculum antarcticum]|uniref:Peptidase S8 n=1 Tax=Labilibaculum antarcticum TaxID=1717717 RepID=A0A1Y1CLU4_9BACT|nr:S8 family serine peptidase [Labilibaculum antarcticum]BAX81270.1 peptidase S8 [Labilibaculum antarcticum]
MKKIIVFLVAGLFFSACSNQFVEEDLDLQSQESVNKVKTQKLSAAQSPTFKASGYLILSDDFSSQMEAEIGKASGKINRKLSEIGMYVVESNEVGFIAKAKKIKGVSDVLPDLQLQWLEPKTTDEAQFVPMHIGSNETFYAYQWGMDAIDAPGAWDQGFTGNGVKVFILDSGIDAEHPDLAPNLNTSLSTSFVPGEDYNIQPGYYFNHGTHVAGIIAAADGPASGLGGDFGVIGVAPKAEIVAVKVLSEYTGSGSFSGINAGVVYAANNGADVINMSLGTSLPRNGFFVELPDSSIVKVGANEVAAYINASQKAITYAYQMGSLVIVAASNDGLDANHTGNLVFIPASLNHLMAVSATAPYGYAYDTTTDLDVPASYTNYGQSLIDIAAPGGDFDHPGDLWYYDMVFSTISSGWGFSAGTSMASPHAAGVAALVFEKLGDDAKPAQVMTVLRQSADDLGKPGKDAYFGNGRVNAARAVQ